MLPLVVSTVASGIATAAIDALVDRTPLPPAPGGTPPAPGSSPMAPSTYPRAVIYPKAGDPGRAARIRAAADLFDRVWTAASGKPGPMPLPAKLLALAQAAAEGTGFGQGWDGDMAGSWNFGSYQAGQAQGGTTWRRVDHKDSRPDPKGGPNLEYTTAFRYYTDGDGHTAAENGALDFLRSITVKPFPALDALTLGDLLRYCRKQYGNHYFEGFNLSPAGLAAYAPSVARLMAGDVLPGAPPIRRTGETPEGVAGRIVFYASSMTRNIPEIAAALGLPAAEPVPVVAGADLVQPWRPAFQAKPGAVQAVALAPKAAPLPGAVLSGVGWGLEGAGVDDLGHVLEIERLVA